MESMMNGGREEWKARLMKGMMNGGHEECRAWMKGMTKGGHDEWRAQWMKGIRKGRPDVLAAIPSLILQEEAPLIIASLIVHNVQHILPHA